MNDTTNRGNMNLCRLATVLSFCPRLASSVGPPVRRGALYAPAPRTQLDNGGQPLIAQEQRPIGPEALNSPRQRLGFPLAARKSGTPLGAIKSRQCSTGATRRP